MNDAQTTGGYRVLPALLKRIATIWRKFPRQPIHFVQCSLEEALKARQDQQRYLEQLAWRLDGKD
jgi:allophanate hydrolase subunit 2